MTENNTEEIEEIQTEKRNKKKKKKLSKKGKILLDVLLVISLGVVCFSGYHLIQAFLTYKQNEDTYNDIASKAEKTEITEEVSPIDWEYLYSVNADTMGWIKLEDSVVDYPIVYATDNEYYLNHTMSGEYNILGTIFVDYTNQRDLQDRVTVLYGHHCWNGMMFTDIGKYKDQSYYDGHKIISLEMPNASYELHPIAGYTTTAYSDYIRTTFDSDEDFMSYVNDFVSKSQFTAEDTATASDKLILLSTCSNDLQDGRFALLCKLVKIKDYSTTATENETQQVEEQPVEGEAQSVDGQEQPVEVETQPEG